MVFGSTTSGARVDVDGIAIHVNAGMEIVVCIVEWLCQAMNC